jgi:CP family cyanate transporter-like MFS transporter
MLVTLAAGSALRMVADHSFVFLLSSAIAGAGMGGATALMPSLIAHYVPRIRGFVMGLYSTGLSLGIALSAGVAVPSAQWLGGWKPALALWGVIALVTAGAWTVAVPLLRRAHRARPVVGAVVNHDQPWRSPTAWWTTWFSASAMVIGFSGLAWISPLYAELGVGDQEAANYLVLFQVAQLTTMLTLPWLTDFTTDRRPLLALVLLCSGAGVACLVLAPLGLAVPAMCLFGAGAGGGSTLALVLLLDVTRSQADAARLSGMVMLLSYTIGALAPLLLGALHDLTGGFTAGYLTILAVIVVTLVSVPAFHPRRRLDAPAGTPAGMCLD